ncbi:hypothetical protein PanWU01x14_328300 [Parasponia andersonii]|uniref:Transmembrane protein n=1 Tax=Parasponia andersonii TaxID=3476 RepID=A0A2P5AIX5_PARAD|nr:hypothetical protein PanWU01x14_328300 [Parasponia andersonii]
MWGVFGTLSTLLFWNMFLFSFPTILCYSVNSPAPNYHEGSHYRGRLYPPPPPPPPAWFYFFSPPPPSPPCTPNVGQPLYVSPPPPRPAHHYRHRHHSSVP